MKGEKEGNVLEPTRFESLGSIGPLKDAQMVKMVCTEDSQSQ